MPREGAAGRGHRERRRGPPAVVRNPGRLSVAFEQRHEEMRAGDIWGKGFWAEGAASRRALDLLQGWVCGGTRRALRGGVAGLTHAEGALSGSWGEGKLEGGSWELH